MPGLRQFFKNQEIYPQSEVEKKITNREIKEIYRVIYFLNLLWEFKPARKDFINNLTTSQRISPENINPRTSHDIVDHLFSGTIPGGYDFIYGYELDLDLSEQNLDQVVRYLLHKKISISDDEIVNFYERNVNVFSEYKEKIEKFQEDKILFKSKLSPLWLNSPFKEILYYKRFLLYYDAMNDDELFKLFVLIDETKDDVEEKVKEYLVQFEPRIRKMWIFNYLIRLNNYDYVDLVLDYLIAGKTIMPGIPDSVLKRNAALNKSFETENVENVFYRHSEYYKLKMIAKVLYLDKKVETILNQIVPTSKKRETIAAYFKNRQNYLNRKVPLLKQGIYTRTDFLD